MQPNRNQLGIIVVVVSTCKAMALACAGGSFPYQQAQTKDGFLCNAELKLQIGPVGKIPLIQEEVKENARIKNIINLCCISAANTKQIIFHMLSLWDAPYNSMEMMLV